MGFCTPTIFAPRREKRAGLEALNLRRLIAARKNAHLRSENIGVIGAENTGRNTLVRRFLNMSEGAFNTPEDRKYTRRAVLVDLSGRPTFHSDETVRLDCYIINARNQGYNDLWRYIPNLKSIVFVFDVSSERTVNIAVSCINRIRQQTAAPPRYIIIGNKIDLQPSSTAMRYIRRQARNCGAERYYECSARENTNMDSVLDAILCLTFFQGRPLPQ